jgi:hypothetical protein
VKYSSSFQYDLKIGETAEDWVNELFSNGKKIEVKNDLMAHKTGNIYIEFESRGKPSGLSKTIADYWIYRINHSDFAFIIEVNKLKELCRKFYKAKKYLKEGGDDNTSKGFLIPIVVLILSLNADTSTRTT